VPKAALGKAAELVQAWALRLALAEMALEEAEAEMEMEETELEVETEWEIEGRIKRRESQERQEMLGQAQTRTNGNPIWGPICRGMKLLRQIGSWTLSMATMFMRTMAVIWMGGFSGPSLAVPVAKIGSALAGPLCRAERYGRAAVSDHPYARVPAGADAPMELRKATGFYCRCATDGTRGRQG
jgi:hypothetical protein